MVFSGNQTIYLGTIQYYTYPNIEKLADFTQKLADSINLTALEYKYHAFANGGITFLRFLAESHIILDIYVETKTIDIMIVSCKAFNAQKINYCVKSNNFKLQKYDTFIKGKFQGWHSPKQKNAIAHIKRESRLESAGLCMICGRNPILNTKYCANCALKGSIRSKERTSALRSKILDHYGRRCSCCSESEYLFLTVDHVNNNGSLERKIYRGSMALYNHIITENYPSQYQILCMNCNFGKRMNGGVCPHKGSK